MGSVPSPERFQAAARGPTALLPGWAGPPWERGLEQGRRCAHLGHLRSPRADPRRQPSQPRRSLCGATADIAACVVPVSGWVGSRSRGLRMPSLN